MCPRTSKRCTQEAPAVGVTSTTRFSGMFRADYSLLLVSHSLQLMLPPHFDVYSTRRFYYIFHSHFKTPQDFHFTSSRNVLLVQQQHQSIFPAAWRFRSIVTRATKAVICRSACIHRSDQRKVNGGEIRPRNV